MIALDEYTADETRDGYDAVEWAAAQPWSSGAVAMWGISYGAFTAIQVAKLRPPHLRAIVPCMGTDDRYVDDVHYRGGCVTASELSQYAVSQVAMNAMPPDATFRGDGWLDEWRARLDATPPWLFEWLRHQTDGPYWRQGSLAPDYDAIDVPIYSIGGWMDSYVDPAFRMQERCAAPTRTLVGNWVHGWPGSAPPGPNLDDLHELVRFLDHHLRGIDNGADTEPPVVWFERGLRAAGAVPGRIAGAMAGDVRLPASVGRSGRVALRGGPIAARRPARRRRDQGPTRIRHRDRPLPAPADDRHALLAVVGRRRPAQRPGSGPAAGRERRADIHDGPLGRRRHPRVYRRSSSTWRSRRRSRPLSSA